ncbi:MAG: NAD(P)/FAD-dependent oxidoreductase [Pseudomonadota bacterium]
MSQTQPVFLARYIMTAATVQDTFDTIVIGAGHNGLGAATVLSERGQRVLVLEKNRYVGGMGGTREILKGCRNEVGASVMFPLSAEIRQYFDFERHGVEFIPLPVMAVNLCGADGRALVFYKNPARLAMDVYRQFGFSAMLGMIRLFRFCTYPASVIDRFTARKTPRSLEQLIAEAPTPDKRRQLELAFRGSAMDIIDRFFPDKDKHRELRGNMAFAAVQATYKGPYTPGSGLCLVYTFAQEGSEGLMQRVKGGMGKLSESLVTRIESQGGEVRLGQRVAHILIEGERAIGVELKDGQQLFAHTIISNLDKPATFRGLLSRHPLPPDLQPKIDTTHHNGAFVHMLFKLKGLPDYAPSLNRLNRISGAKFGGAMVVDPETMQHCYETCLSGRLPSKMPIAFQFPTVHDPSLAPDGFHIASAYGFYFPCSADKKERGKLRDRAADLIIDQITEYMPAFRELITDQAIFSADHFESMHGATNGDWTHGAIHPELMLGERCLIPGSGHGTHLQGLYLCGATCHPGPGVTFLPGYNCAHEVLAQADHAEPQLDISATTLAPEDRAA